MQMASLYALLIVVVFVFLRFLFPAKPKPVLGKTSTRRSHRAERRASSVAGNSFHAVSIHPSAEGCLAAEAIRGERFLSAEAPSLPLEACTAAACNCRYAHHADRRCGTRSRRGLHPAEDDFLGFSGGLNRRMCEGRRDSDLMIA